MKRFLILIVVLISISGCKKAEKTDYLIFGKFYGFCVSDCITLYKVTNKNLYLEKPSDYLENEIYKGNFSNKINNKLSIAKPLLDMVPTKLLDEELFIGCPDCADQGGYFIQYEKDGEEYYFKIDTFKDNVPDYLHDFLNEVDAVMADLE